MSSSLSVVHHCGFFDPRSPQWCRSAKPQREFENAQPRKRNHGAEISILPLNAAELHSRSPGSVWSLAKIPRASEWKLISLFGSLYSKIPRTTLRARRIFSGMRWAVGAGRSAMMLASLIA
jgi:hypothetical protein